MQIIPNDCLFYSWENNWQSEHTLWKNLQEKGLGIVIEMKEVINSMKDAIKMALVPEKEADQVEARVMSYAWRQ